MYRPPSQQQGFDFGSWFASASATFAGALLAGALLLLGVRSYVQWSVADAAAKMEQRIDATRPTK